MVPKKEVVFGKTENHCSLLMVVGESGKDMENVLAHVVVEFVKVLESVITQLLLTVGNTAWVKEYAIILVLLRNVHLVLLTLESSNVLITMMQITALEVKNRELCGFLNMTE